MRASKEEILDNKFKSNIRQSISRQKGAAPVPFH